MNHGSDIFSFIASSDHPRFRQSAYPSSCRTPANFRILFPFHEYHITKAATMTGLIHFYTGDGKGENDRRARLAIRAAGRACASSSPVHEDGRLVRARSPQAADDLIAVRTYGRPGFVRGNPDPEDVRNRPRGFRGGRRRGAFGSISTGGPRRSASGGVFGLSTPGTFCGS